MRKTKVLVALSFMVLVTPMVMGATITLANVTANPGGVKNRLDGDGSYTLANKEEYAVTTFQATDKTTGQINNIAGNKNGLNWSATLNCGPATYNPCEAKLYFLDAKGKAQEAKDTNNKDQAVK